MTFSRISISLLILFETLNFAGILHFTLDFSWLGLIITSAFSLMVIEFVYSFLRKRGHKLSSFPYLISVVGLYIDAFGDIRHLYGKISWYDQMAHFFGGAAVMALSLVVLPKLINPKIPLALLLFLGISVTSLFGSFYEIEEYLEDAFYNHRQVRLGDGPDTANDLLLNLYGATAVGIIYYFSEKRKTNFDYK